MTGRAITGRSDYQLMGPGAKYQIHGESYEKNRSLIEGLIMELNNKLFIDDDLLGHKMELFKINEE